MVKNLSATAGDIRYLGLILGSERHPEGCHHLPVGAGQSSILAWTIIWTEEPGRIQSIGRIAKSQTTEET